MQSRLADTRHLLFSSGFLLVFISVTTLFIFAFQNSAVEKNGLLVLNSEELIFVKLTESVKKSPSGNYYFSYTGTYGGESFRKSERVDSDFFHITSEGKNVQAKIYRDRWGNIHSILRENKTPYGRNYDSVKTLSLWLLAAGLAMLSASLYFFLFAEFRSRGNKNEAD